MPQFIGDNIMARDEQGRPRARIATVFPRGDTIVTLPGIHATQRLAYAQDLNDRRVAQGLAPLGDDELEAQCLTGVDLVLEGDNILIRPDPADMQAAFEADELLQQIVPKEKIKFLHVLDPQVREAIKRRGECWRISALPRSPDEMSKMIADSKIAIGGRDLYFYNNTTGTRFLTFAAFSSLASLDEHELRRHLAEIGDHSNSANRMGRREVAFYMAEGTDLPAEFARHDFLAIDSGALRGAYEDLRRRFHDAAPPEFRRDELNNPNWRGRMYATLIGQTDEAVSEEAMLGLAAEFFMPVAWLPGGRIEDGELIFDPILEDEAKPCRPDGHPLCDEKARGFIFNFIRDYGDLEHVNIGRVAGSLSSRGEWPGRRGVYLADVRERGNPRPILRVIRMQKWGVSENLDKGEDLLQAMLESEEYTEYILDRRIGCRQLGMNLPARVAARKLGERYAGKNPRYLGRLIWSAYFERDYVAGLATDKVAAARFADDAFALNFARLLGRAAAPNLIVGRCDLHGNAIFDDGDELVIVDACGMPIDIVVADPTGTFTDYLHDLRDLAPGYAGAINRRLPFLNDPRAFARTFLAAFVDRFNQVRQEYIKRQRAFDTLFKHLPRDEAGSFRYRWESVLRRLQTADAAELAEGIGRGIKG